jgi:hypothetical protein
MISGAYIPEHACPNGSSSTIRQKGLIKSEGPRTLSVKSHNLLLSDKQRQPKIRLAAP